MNRIHLLRLALAFAVFCAPSAVSAQQFLGKPLVKWQADLDAKDAQVRRGAVFALGKFPDSASRVVPSLLTRLKNDDDAGVRDAAATALGDVMQAIKSDKSEDADPRAAFWKDAEPVLRRALDREHDAQALRGVLYAIGS